MTLLSRSELRDLATLAEKPCVSLFLPAESDGFDVQRGSARFQNLLRDAENQLAEAGWWRPDAIEWLKPAHAIDQPGFWHLQRGGLAVFIAPNYCRHYALPINFEEKVMIGDRFHLSPLIPALTGDGRFFILAFGQNRIRLFLCSPDSMSEVELEEMPQALQIALQNQDYEDQIEQRHLIKTQAATPPQKQIQEIQDAIVGYCQQINTGLNNLLRGERSPLILAGIQYVASIYRKTNTYPSLLSQTIGGNPDIMKPSLLHQEALQIVRPHFLQVRQEAAERYRALTVSEQASGKLQDVIPAAFRQQVDTLFVSTEAEQWGRYNPEGDRVQLHSTAQPDDINLLEAAMLQTLIGGGRVYQVEPQRMPERTSLAAIFRYPLSAARRRYQPML
jgi:hypothetical protein